MADKAEKSEAIVAEPSGTATETTATPEQAESRGDEHLEPYTVLSPVLRDGKVLSPGSIVRFLAHEVQHVDDLVERKVLHRGTGPVAQSAVENAERERALARNTPA